jgi:hypothetical protein
MGVWGYGLLESDDALDAVVDIELAAKWPEDAEVSFLRAVQPEFDGDLGPIQSAFSMIARRYLETFDQPIVAAALTMALGMTMPDLLRSRAVTAIDKELADVTSAGWDDAGAGRTAILQEFKVQLVAYLDQRVPIAWNPII